MCLSVCFQINNRLEINSFAQPGAILPVRKKDGELSVLPWGRRVGEKGKLPLGGCLPLAMLKQNHFAQYFPKAVKLPILKFEEKDVEDKPMWFDVTAGNWVQGVYLKEKEEGRLYVVTIEPYLTGNKHQYPRWPHIVCSEKT